MVWCLFVLTGMWDYAFLRVNKQSWTGRGCGYWEGAALYTRRSDMALNKEHIFESITVRIVT
jgi:hypothetical protein